MKLSKANQATLTTLINDYAAARARFRGYNDAACAHLYAKTQETEEGKHAFAMSKYAREWLNEEADKLHALGIMVEKFG